MAENTDELKKAAVSKLISSAVISIVRGFILNGWEATSFDVTWTTIAGQWLWKVDIGLVIKSLGLYQKIAGTIFKMGSLKTLVDLCRKLKLSIKISQSMF